MENMRIQDIKLNPSNPRTITDEKMEQLVKSIQDFPQMLHLRPIVIDKDNVVLGGNMRLQACKIAGVVDVPVLRAENLTEQQKQEFIIKDNVGFGEWDWEALSSEWNTDELSDWGLDVPVWEKDGEAEEWLKEQEYEEYQEDDVNDSIYTNKIEAPVYEPGENKPSVSTLVDTSRYEELVKDIDSSDLPEEEKHLLRLAATRHIIFSYKDIANYYAHSKKDTQALIEDSALVIIDFNKSVELGYVKVSDEILNQYQNEYE